MTPDERDKLLDLHRASTNALARLHTGMGHPDDYTAYFDADDAFREYLFSLEVSA